MVVVLIFAHFFTHVIFILSVAHWIDLNFGAFSCQAILVTIFPPIGPLIWEPAKFKAILSA